MTFGYWLSITDKLVVVSNYNCWDNQIISQGIKQFSCSNSVQKTHFSCIKLTKRLVTLTNFMDILTFPLSLQFWASLKLVTSTNFLVDERIHGRIAAGAQLFFHIPITKELVVCQPNQISQPDQLWPWFQRGKKSFSINFEWLFFKKLS